MYETGSSSSSELGEAHSLYHKEGVSYVDALIREYRADLGIEPSWKIIPQMVCAHALGGRNALLTWHLDYWQAVLTVRCNLSDDQILWEVVHELYELQRYRTGHLFLTLLGQLSGDQQEVASIFLDAYRLARNQEIELACQQCLKRVRPLDITVYGVPDGGSELIQILESTQAETLPAANAVMRRIRLEPIPSPLEGVEEKRGSTDA